MELVSVPVIIAVVYMIIEGLKRAIAKEGFNRIIPILSLILGVIFGILSFYLAPSIILADNVFTAGIIGGLSGWSSTGADQVIKQLSKKE